MKSANAGEAQVDVEIMFKITYESFYSGAGLAGNVVPETVAKLENGHLKILDNAGAKARVFSRSCEDCEIFKY